MYADAITTVSKTYAYEITTPEGGEGLDGLMRARSDVLFGITNGIDYGVYNPKTDPHLMARYDVTNIARKKTNKAALQKKMGLPEDETVFLMGMVSRMTDQKGFDLIAYVLDEMLSSDNIQFVVAGTGEERYESMLHHFADKYPDKMRGHIGYSEEIAHQIYGSCDAFLMPSLFEPCGLSQLMSMRYGTIPIVRETGGLRDTVEPYNEYEKTGYGFSFANYNAHEMLATIRYAKKVYETDKKSWNGLIERAMEQDYSWESSARCYEELYDQMTRL